MTHQIKDGRFVCTAEQEAPCRNYPDCECETWDDLHEHERVPQALCWLDPWINDVGLEDSYWGPAGREDAHGMEFPDGPIEHDWNGDCVTWRYADATLPVWGEEED